MIARPAMPEHSPCRAGAVAVELALVLPVLLLFVIGAVDYGRVIHHQTALANAVFEGANYGATHPVSERNRQQWEARLREAVRREAASIAGFEPESLQVRVETFADGDDATRVTIDAQYPFQTLVNWPLWKGSHQLRHQVSMRQYR